MFNNSYLGHSCVDIGSCISIYALKVDWAVSNILRK